MSELDGKPLRYLIGGDDSYEAADDEVVELSYDVEDAPTQGVGIKYGNLFNEKYDDQTTAERAKYGPYLEPGDTASEYGEGQIDPAGQGWAKNLDEQFARAVAGGFRYIELDNPDSYAMDDVIDAVDRAQNAGLFVIAKNPDICEGDKVAYLAHPAVVGVIVERDCGTPDDMDALRMMAGKPDLPVWFVAFGGGKNWAGKTAKQAEHYPNMGVTYCEDGEYEDSVDILVPAGPPPTPDNEVAVTISTPRNVTVTINGVPVS